MKLLTHDSRGPVKCLNSVIHSVTLLVSYFCPHRSLKTSKLLVLICLRVCACVVRLCVCGPFCAHARLRGAANAVI